MKPSKYYYVSNDLVSSQRQDNFGYKQSILLLLLSPSVKKGEPHNALNIIRTPLTARLDEGIVEIIDFHESE